MDNLGKNIETSLPPLLFIVTFPFGAFSAHTLRLLYSPIKKREGK